MTGTALAAIETALRAWILAGSGLGDANVIWQDGGGPRPATPFIAMKHDITPYGLDYTRYTVDSTSNGHDGHEMIATAYGDREGILTLQAFALPTSTLAGSAAALLESVVAAQALPSIRAALRAANISIASFGPIQNIGGKVQQMAVFEPRAVLEVHFWATSQVSEAATCIDTITIGVTGTDASGPTFTVTSP